MKKRFFQQLLFLLICVVVMAVAAIQRDGKLMGRQLKGQREAPEQAAGLDTLKRLPDGTVVINTTGLAKDINGYGGTVPLELYVKDGKVVRVKALRNMETPEFFEEASQLLTRWDGKTIDEAQQLHVDGVSGATFTSRAIIGNVQRGLQYASKNAVEPGFLDRLDHSPKALAGLLVVLMGAIIPLFYRSKRYRLVQQVLNVGVLGLWCGTFLSYSLLMGYLSSGINLWVSLIPVVMLVTAFVYPLFGKKNHYCNHICPCGAAQELACRVTKKKLRLSQKTVRRLTLVRRVLWVVLMALMLLGVGFEWMDYEIFSAFIFQSASVVVLLLAGIFLVLSLFIARPYCRFVCPTGTLFKMAQGSK